MVTRSRTGVHVNAPQRGSQRRAIDPSRVWPTDIGGAVVTSDPTADQIAQAALEQFSDLGIRRSSIDDVAKRAGVSRMTVFRRFGNKEQLVRAAIEREIRRAWDELNNIWADAQTVEDRLIEALLFAVHFLRDHPLYDRLVRSEPEFLLPMLTLDGQPVLQLYRSLAAAWLHAETERGAIAPADPDTTCEVIARLVLSLVLTPDTQREDDRDHVVRIVRGALMPMLRADWSV